MDSVEAYWRDFVARRGGDAPAGACVARRIGNTPEVCAEILELVIGGLKTGTFSLPRALREAGTLPAPGDHVVLLHFDGTPACLVRIDHCETVAFRDIGPEHLDCEGPGARDRETWARIHEAYWTPMLARWGETFSPDIPVLVQRFTLLDVAPGRGSPAYS